MALIECSECGKKVFDKASVCQGCGCPIGVGNSFPASTLTHMGKSQIFRLVGSFGFLLVAIGFFMPWASPTGFAALLINQLNGFHLASLALGEAEQLSETLVGVFMYACFIFAAIGLIIGVLSLAKVTVPVLVDFVISFACIVSFLYMLVEAVIPEIDYMILHSGFYVVVVGLMVAFIASSASYAVGKRASQTSKPVHILSPKERLLATFIPPVGLGLFFRWREANLEKAKGYRKDALHGVIMYVLVLLIHNLPRIFGS